MLLGTGMAVGILIAFSAANRAEFSNAAVERRWGVRLSRRGHFASRVAAVLLQVAIFAVVWQIEVMAPRNPWPDPLATSSRPPSGRPPQLLSHRKG